MQPWLRNMISERVLKYWLKIFWNLYWSESPYSANLRCSNQYVVSEVGHLILPVSYNSRPLTNQPDFFSRDPLRCTSVGDAASSPSLHRQELGRSIENLG